MWRGLSAIGAGVMLAAVVGGCDWTAMSAADMRQPVLLGPVPCIGCAARSTDAAGAAASQVGAHRRTFAVFAFVGPVYADSEPIGVSLDRLMYWTPCTDDVHLSNVRARAWQLNVPLLYFQSDVAIDADATPVPVPGATCPPPH